MAVPALITRRAALVGAIASATAVGVAATQARAKPYPEWSPIERAKYHASEATKAMQEATEAEWVFTVGSVRESEPSFIIIRRIVDVGGGKFARTPIPGIDY